MLVDSIQAFDPDSCLLEKLFCLFFFPELFLLACLRFLAADAVGMVGLVIQHQNILFAAHLSPKDAVQ